MNIRYLLAFALLGAMAPAFATTPAANPAAPNCPAMEFHQLDFWLGDWDTQDVEAKDTTSVARTHVDPIAASCAVHELYEQTDGLIGDSILSYDPVRKQWQQTWVTNHGSIMQIYGNFKDGTLTLQGETHLRDGRTIGQRITWKAEGKGVRETGVSSKDNGKTWEPYFDVLFVKHVGT
jgi:hypothetical protein